MSDEVATACRVIEMNTTLSDLRMFSSVKKMTANSLKTMTHLLKMSTKKK